MAGNVVGDYWKFIGVLNGIQNAMSDGGGDGGGYNGVETKDIVVLDEVKVEGKSGIILTLVDDLEDVILI
ncbi:hypothetical protein K443DRAFT_10741 [Laccaria amethystina LaAM-08-1]|uniref:Uncharacterized protein n=1 Tax=Laccaria amethystina LaAM-08-1 TaxID=1095629 RepID=A0A0C9XJ80_9AGAR|nr:hypothetical protein K443DRAFT_10741 [Laccaria amethystina LaAM-08-1]